MFRTAPLLTVAAAVLLFQNFSKAQETIWPDGFNVGRTAEMNISVSPAFDLMGLTPSKVIKPTTSHEMRVDWLFRSYHVKPNLDVQVQPVWEIFFNRTSLRKYQQASYLMRSLASLDFSLGTVEDDNQVRRVAMALKINLFQQNDPLLNKRLYYEFGKDYYLEQGERVERINQLNQLLRMSKRTKTEKSDLYFERDSLEMEYEEAIAEQKDKIRRTAEKFGKRHWNAAQIDLCAGKIFTYDQPRFDSLNLQGEAQSVWVNACLGIGRRWLVSGLARYSFVWREPELEEISMGRGEIWTGGTSLRFGSPRFVAFVEGVVSGGSSMKTIADGGLNHIGVSKITVSYGGDWRINPNAMFSFGLHTNFSEGMKFENVMPVVGVSCMMR